MENCICTEINDLCRKLDTDTFLTEEKKDEILLKIKTLVEMRDNLRKILNNNERIE